MRVPRRLQDPNKAIWRIRGMIHSEVTGPTYTGASQETLSISNNAVLFQGKLAKVLSMTDGGVWALTLDRPSSSGLSHHRPSLDHMTPLRRELLQDVLGDHLGTYD